MRIVESWWNGWRVRMGRRLALGLLAALSSVACGSLPRTNYYTLRLPPPPDTRDPQVNVVLGIEPFRATGVLRDDRIVFYESPTELHFYEYHRWSVDPATMLTDLVARRLVQRAVFLEIRRLPAREPVDYILRARVLSFEEVDYAAGVKGRVALEMTLVRSRDRKTLWSETRQAESAAEGKGVAAVVNALDAASARLLDELLPVLVAQVERDLPQGSQPSPP
jgi:ABC-type uncharacterized transport system auxiliary subunit